MLNCTGVKIINIFSGIMAKIAAVFAALAGVFFFIMRYQSNKIDKLEDENAKIKKKSQIQTQAAEDKARITDAEQEELLRISKEVNSNDKDITVDDVNNW